MLEWSCYCTLTCGLPRNLLSPFYFLETWKQIPALPNILVESVGKPASVTEEPKPVNWFHEDCANLSDSMFNILGCTDLPRECCNCGQSNFLSGLSDLKSLSASDTTGAANDSCLSSSAHNRVLQWRI